MTAFISYNIIIHACISPILRSRMLIGPSIDTALAMPSTCISEIGIAVGAVTVVESLIVSVIAVIVVLCLWR